MSDYRHKITDKILKNFISAPGGCFLINVVSNEREEDKLHEKKYPVAMKNRQSVSHGFDMLNDDKTLKNIEVKTSRSIFVPADGADRSTNEVEEVVARSDSSSGGSSLADLRKRLQHIPSPHSATRLANHAFHISRRLFQKRAIYLHSQSNPIEENTKREEKEEREALFAKSSVDDPKSTDARERRRAKLRLENATSRAMVVSKPGETSASNFKKDTTDEQTSDKSVSIESKTEDIFARKPVPPLETMLNCSPLANKHYTPLSARLPSTRSPYRNQPGDPDNDSSVRQSTYRSCGNSPKDKVDLQPRSPVPFGDARPTRFGGYRPQTGLILQNLSSGSEAESNRDVTPNRIARDRTTDCLIPIASRGTSISLCDTNARVENFNDSLPSLSLSTRRSSNRSPVNSARKDHSESIIVSSVSKRNTDAAKFFASSASPRMGRYSHCFPGTANTSRSDGGKSMKHVSRKSVEEPMFFSAREEIRGHGREHLNTPPSLLETPARINISPRDRETELPGESRRSTLNLEANVPNSSTHRSGVENSYENKREVSANVPLGSPNSGSGVEGKNGAFTSTENTTRSPRSALHSPGSKSPSSGRKESSRPSIDASAALRQTLSKCILNYGSSNDVKSPRPGDTVLSRQFKTGRSGTQSRAPSREELFVGEFLKMLEDNLLSPKSTRHGQQLTDNDPHKMANEEKFVNIPTLALPSQEVSLPASPTSKICSDGRLDADTLITALSNVSPTQQTTKDVSENTRSNSCAGTKTISRPGSSENNLSFGNCSGQGSSRFVDQSTSTTQGTSCRRSPSARSRIPVKIPASAGKQSVVSKSSEAGREMFNQRRSPVKSSGQSSRRNSSSPEMLLKYGSGRSDRVSRSCETSPSIKDYPITNIEEAAEVVSDATINVDTREQSSYSSSKYSRNKLEGVRRTDAVVRGVQSRLCFTLQSDRSSYDKSEISGRGQKLVSKVSSKGTSCDESSTNRPAMPDTSRSSQFSDNWKDRESIEQNAPPDNNSSLESNSDISSSSSYDAQESVKQPEQVKTIVSNVKSMGIPFENYPGKYFNAAYEGEVYDKEVEERKSNPMKNQIGDGGCSEIQIEGPRKGILEEVSFDSSPDDEEYIRGKRIAENRDKLRFSLEKLAAEQFRRSISTEQTKTIQSDTTAFFSEKFYEIPQFSLVCSSSASRLRHDKSRDSPRFKKKSQDRFPFTISEKTSVASVKFKVPDCRLGNLDEDEEDRGYKLDTHPSITRLAGSGFEDSPADIISYVTETEHGNRRVKPSGMKDLVKKFSARWKKSKRVDDGTDADTKVTNIIYKNSDYRDECDSSMESFSESSLLKEFRMHENLEEKLCKNNGESPDEKSSTVFDKQSLDEEESSRDTPVSNVNPCRRYDRDDQWVQAFKNLDPNREEQKGDEETSNNVDESTSTRDPYSVFFVKSALETPDTSARTFRPENDEQKQNVLTARRKNRVKFRSSSLLVTQKFSDESFYENAGKRRNSERVKKNRNAQGGCLCLRFYRMIIPISFRPMSKYRSRINVNSPFTKTGPRSSTRKKKG